MPDPHVTLRFGMVIGLRDECREAYVDLHRGEGVRDVLHEANIRNFRIYLQRMPDGALYEFATYDYVGADHAADMERLARSQANQAWLALCDPMQVPLPGHTGWAVMDEIYFNP